MTELSLTRKVRLYPTTEQATEFRRVMSQYRDLCNLASQHYFDNYVFNKKSQQSLLNKELYHDFRDRSDLGAGLVQSVFKTVIARYRTTETQLRSKPYRYDTGKKDQNGHAIWSSAPRDLNWLWKPINFHRLQADYVRTKNYSLTNDATLISMNGLHGRLKVRYNQRERDFLLRKDIKLGTAKLITSGGHWFFHVSYTYNVPDFEMDDVQHVVGIDRGLRFLATTYDERGKSLFFNGGKAVNVRRHDAGLRKHLQMHNTRNSKRRIRELGHKENRYITWINHTLTKALIDHYGSHTLFVMENLTGIKENTLANVQKNRRYLQVSWSYYQFQQMLEYKAKQVGSKVVYVNAYKTSQRCPKCGRINKSNRKHGIHEYQCDRCGYRSNDDRIGAMNIYYLGTMVRSGVSKPSFKPSK